jgi:hypothetical protein
MKSAEILKACQTAATAKLHSFKTQPPRMTIQGRANLWAGIARQLSLAWYLFHYLEDLLALSHLIRDSGVLAEGDEVEVELQQMKGA